MLNVGLKNALSVWLDLDDAYYGRNRYGGDVAEIYAYRLMPFSPRGANGMDDHVPQAAKDFVSLLEMFEEARRCSVLVDGVSPSEWLKTGVSGFVHRAHVTVIDGRKRD